MENVQASQTVAISFITFLLVFVVIGALSVLKNRHTSNDYLLASHSVPPWLTGLSAIATNNSGFMFVGLIGFTYTQGLSAMWLMIGWIIGDMLISLIVHQRMRRVTEEQYVLSYGGVLAKWNNTDFRLLRMLVGLMTVLFLGAYAGAQLNAGSKALHVLFGWDYAVGALVGSAIVLIYCFAGGIRASIWTDAAQSFVMLGAMAAMFILTVIETGGLGAFWQQIGTVDAHYRDIFPHNLGFGPVSGPVLFVIGWLFAGFGVVGQPHIMVRFMAMDNPEHMCRVPFFYYSWYVVFSALTIGVGMAARLLLELGEQEFDAELALPMLAMQIMPDIIVGLVLAGLFAATMSTADSQILSCTAGVSRDLCLDKITSYWLTKIVTVIVTVIALMIALFGYQSVFYLIKLSWAALGAAFAPLLIVYALRQRPNEPLSLAMITGGFGAMLGWWLYGDTTTVYHIMPGMLTGLVIFLIGKALGFTLPPQTRNST